MGRKDTIRYEIYSLTLLSVLSLFHFFFLRCVFESFWQQHKGRQVEAKKRRTIQMSKHTVSHFKYTSSSDFSLIGNSFKKKSCHALSRCLVVNSNKEIFASSLWIILSCDNFSSHNGFNILMDSTKFQFRWLNHTLCAARASSTKWIIV